MRYLDFTQYNAADKCILYWYEKYFRGFRKVQEYQSDSAATLGSLVHSGLENYYKFGEGVISPEAIEDTKPTPECVNNAEFLIRSWVSTHPKEEWSMARFETRLEFPIREGWVGAAKLDKFFEVQEQTIIKSGLEGHEIELYPGYWIVDYKTLGDSKKRANYIKRYNSDMQVGFQMLALKEYIRTRGGDPSRVQGVLIGVIEKPHLYAPKRKCKGCRGTYDIGLYKPLPNGKYECGWCKFEQSVSPVKKTPGFVDQPTMYYIRCERSSDKLTDTMLAISNMTQEMDEIINNNNYRPRYGNCIDMIYGECEYYSAHIEPGFDVAEHSEFVHIDNSLKYMESN